MSTLFLVLRFIFLTAAGVVGTFALFGGTADQDKPQQMRTDLIWAVCAVGLGVCASACREPEQRTTPQPQPQPQPPGWGPADLHRPPQGPGFRG